MSDSSCPAPVDPRSPWPHLPHRSCLSAPDSTRYSKETAEARIITWLVVHWLTSVSSIGIVFLTSIIFLTFKFCESYEYKLLIAAVHKTDFHVFVFRYFHFFIWLPQALISAHRILLAFCHAGKRGGRTGQLVRLPPSEGTSTAVRAFVETGEPHADLVESS